MRLGGRRSFPAVTPFSAPQVHHTQRMVRWSGHMVTTGVVYHWPLGCGPEYGKSPRTRRVSSSLRCTQRGVKVNARDVMIGEHGSLQFCVTTLPTSHHQATWLEHLCSGFVRFSSHNEVERRVGCVRAGSCMWSSSCCVALFHCRHRPACSGLHVECVAAARCGACSVPRSHSVVECGRDNTQVA